MHIQEYIEKIIENNEQEDMEELSNILQDVVYDIKEYDYDKYCEYKMKLYTMAYGKVLTREMADEWVKNMKPMAKWDYETTTAVKNQKGIKDISDIAFYVVMNMLYSDMMNILGDGNEAESVDKYVQATIDWLNDEDIKGNGDEKLYNYYFYVAK